MLIHKEGDRLVLTPVREYRLADLLASWEPLPDSWPEVEDLPAQDRTNF
jgi:hypothetical protein